MHATGRLIAQFCESYDLLLTATLAEPPAAVGRFAMSNPDFLDYRLGPKGIIHYSPFTSLFNITGQPAMSMPLHWSKAGLADRRAFRGQVRRRGDAAEAGGAAGAGAALVRQAAALP